MLLPLSMLLALSGAAGVKGQSEGEPATLPETMTEDGVIDFLTEHDSATNQPPVPVGMLADRTLEFWEEPVLVGIEAAFQDPDGDALSYGASSSSEAIAAVSVSAAGVWVTPAAAGSTATITVTATDPYGEQASQTFKPFPGGGHPPRPGSAARSKDARRSSEGSTSPPTSATPGAPPVSCPLPWSFSVRIRSRRDQAGSATFATGC